ncbi:hypothetical protein BG015_010584 [Linnemannia schmuckeri]|uniref:SGT1-domain-containing protein n=1 Tax=Linnemannia schmuckeri TaxID=64567 RepID=A0A9P5RTT7_9FUNG|nr:hypothetical protein BG015_010584 [Linnemannia schmuckeri]
MDSSFPPRESIQEQRRALAEDTVSYAIYLPSSPSTSTSSTSSTSSTTTTTTTTTDPSTQIQDQPQQQQHHAAALESAQVARTLISSIVAEVCEDYIWHKDAFSLTITSGQGKGPTGQPYLRGQTRFGDSIDDEWIVVHLLREITKRIPGSIARVQDNDGEFLLIEAADHIPAWLDSENSDNRVFIYQGNLHIIPIATTADEKKAFPTILGSKSRSPKLQDSLELIRSTTTTATGFPQISTLASTKIQQVAFGPLLPDSQDLPFAQRKIQEQRHYARCQIPVQVARILKARPELVTRAVEAFYTRDAVAMAVCSRMSKFLPTPAPAVPSSSTPMTASGGAQNLGKNETPFVTTAVCFTKTCYAQLMGQQFQPPKIWDGIVPPSNLEDAQDHQKVREAELGMKLTCGFEILCSQEYPGDFGFRSKDEIRLDSFPFATDDSWRVFKSNLALRSYFGDEREGSARYQQLEEVAKRQFLEYKSDRLNADEIQSEDGFSVSFHGHGYHPVQEIERILDVNSTTPVDVKELVDDRKSDDDSWMDVDLQDLEDMMRARGFGGGSGSTKTEDQGERSGLDMQQMLDRFGAFVEDGEGGVEGAEFLDEISDDDSDEDDGKDTEESEEDKDKTVQADVWEPEETEEEDDSDEDMFASDYEEKQAAKRAAKAKRGNKSGGGAFLFGTDMMNFENGVTPATSDASKATEDEARDQAQAFAIDHGKFKDILVQTFGVPSPSSRAAKESAGDVDMSEGDDEEDDMDDEKLKEYMSALDAELSATKVGESFEKTTASSISKATSNGKEDKGKGVPRKTSATATAQKTKKKPEKDLEELMKEATDRSRRGFSRHGPLGMSPGPSFGYDSTGMSFADDEDDEEEEGVRKPRVATISADGEVVDELDELDDDDDEVEEMDQEMVDLDLNLAKNLLESFKSQGGLPGPGGNLLSRLGIILPRDDDDEDDNDGYGA